MAPLALVSLTVRVSLTRVVSMTCFQFSYPCIMINFLLSARSAYPAQWPCLLFLPLFSRPCFGTLWCLAVECSLKQLKALQCHSGDVFRQDAGWKKVGSLTLTLEPNTPPSPYLSTVHVGVVAYVCSHT